ncbi:EamA family transporter [Sphaerisporangium viridialbum]|uniref:EamA family transporter n=1 Tax=Sphaerisporangium viridialbum TaxID=46189 RepID=UPI003C7325CA
MSPAVVAAVLGSAVLHAAWNALATAIPDHRVASALMGAAFVSVAGVGVCLVPPPDRASWPYLAASAVLQSAYLLLLVNAYRRGEFGKVYPLARGTSPLLVTAVAVPLLGDRLSAGQLAGVAVLSVALCWLVFAGGRPAAGSWRGHALALTTGVTIAAYTIVDGAGVRQSGHALSYALWLFLLQGLLIIGVCLATAGLGFRTGLTLSWRRGLLGGVLSLAAYAIVLWAQTRSPLALVSALRETSVLFAVAIGAVVFAEKITAQKVAATVLAFAGIALIKVTA